MRTISTIIVMVLVTIVSSILLLVSFWLALVCFLMLTTLFIVNGIKMIPANPPHKGILVFLGKRQEIVLDEGWNFIPICPLIFNFILIKVEKVVQDLPEQIVRTPDLAEIGVKVSLTWVPGTEAEYGKSLINYLNTGGEQGVKNNLFDMIEARLRTWAASNQEGPSDWIEAMASKGEALAVLLKAIFGDSLPKIDSDIPTTVWMKFFSKPKRKPSKNEIDMGWSSKDGKWEGLQKEFGELSPEDQKTLQSQVEKRMEIVKTIEEGIPNIEEGEKKFSQSAMGVTFLRFTVNEVSVRGQTAKAAELEAKEEQEARAERTELKNVSERIQDLRKENSGMSIEEAVRIVQTERGKISKSVIEVLGASTGIGQDFLGALGFQRMSSGSSGGNPASTSPGKEGENKNSAKTREKMTRDLDELEEELLDELEGDLDKEEEEEDKK